MTEKRVNGNTKTAAKMALQRKAISEESHAAVLAGDMSLQEAKDLGRGAGPSGPVVRVDKNDRTRHCIACGGTTKGGRFHPGCDAKMHRLAREYVRGERELTEEQLVYVRDETDKLERAKARVERENRKKAAKDQARK